MIYIHRKDVVHRDLKLDNILLKRLPNKNWIVKLSDFGQARQLRYREQILRGFNGN